MVSHSKLASEMFEDIVDRMSDKHIEHLHDCLIRFKEKSGLSYKRILHIPFVNTLFDMIEDQYAYRNQSMMDDQDETTQDSDASEPESALPVQESYTSFYMK